MESEAKPVIILKTQGQLKQQTNQVNLQQSFSSRIRSGLPKEFLENPAEFKKGLWYYRASDWDKRPPPLIPQHEPYRQYEEYLKVLREIRKSQAGYLDKQVQTRQAGVSPKEAYLDAAQYSPDLGRQVLTKINDTVKYGDPYIITPNEIKTAFSTENGFFAAVDKALNQKPGIFYNVFNRLKYALPEDKIREAVIKVGTHYGFIDHFKDLKALFSPEEQKALISPIMYEGRYGHGVVEMFKDPDAVKLFSPDEIKKAVMTGLENNVLPFLMNDQITFYIKKGILVPQDVETIILERIRGFEGLENLKNITPLLPEPQTLERIKAEIVDTYTNRATVRQLINLPDVDELLTPEQKLQIVKETVFRDKFRSGFQIPTCEGLVTPELFAPILREVIYSPDMPLTKLGVEEILRSKSLTLEEKETYIDHIISIGEGQLLLDKIGMNLFQFKNQQKRDEIARKIFSSCEPKEIASKYAGNDGTGNDGWDFSVSTELVQEFIAGASFKVVDSWLYQLDKWCPRLEKHNPGFVAKYLEQHRNTHVISMLYQLDKVVSYLPEDRKKAFVLDLIHSDPVATLATLQEQPDTFTKVGIDLSPTEIIAMATSDTGRLSFAPKILREFYKQYSPSAPVEEQKALLMEAYNIYRAIAFVKDYGLETDFRRVQTSRDTPLSAEKELISTFYCFTLLKGSNPEQFAKIGSLGNTLEESKQILFNQFSQLLGLNKQFSQEEVSRFFGTMETPIPFMIYLLQYKDNPKHRKLLTEIFNSITAGKFNEWKFGQITPEAFEALKQSKLIPEKLTFEQYTIWRTDGQITLFESLATDTETTANAIRDYLESNLNHLEIQHILDHLIKTYPNQDLMVGLQQELASLGQQLATTNKDLTVLRKQNLPENVQMISQLEQTKAAAEDRRKALLRARKIFRLINLKSDEVAAGYFLEGKESKQRGDSIAKVLNELKGSSAEENGFVYNELNNMLVSLKTSSDEKQDLVSTDSSNPKVWIEIGEKPIASCQSYDYGSHNECLIGYTDPNTKIIVLRNQKGKIIARSIFRLLETSNGNPALHIERVYSSSTSKGVLRSIFARAYQKADEMGLPLLTSEQSQDEGEVEKETKLAEGFELKTVDYSLYSKASRAPKVYVDSAGGVWSDGEFEMKKLAEIHRQG